jgi:hypothetical protein
MSIVINGGFETGVFSPWTTSGHSLPIISTDSPHTGIYSTLFRGISKHIIGSLSQTLTTVPGTVYTITFWLKRPAVSFNGILIITWNTTHIDTLIFPTGVDYPYTMYTYSATATTVSTNLTFNAILPTNKKTVHKLFLDDVSVIPNIVCFAGDSLILTRDKNNNDIREIRADHVYSDVHEVYSYTKQQFVPIVYNIVTGPINRFMLIEKDSIDINVPNNDLYITSGHKIFINGKEIKAKELPCAKRVKVKPQKIYTICVDEHQAILVNNLPVVAWGIDEWNQSLLCKRIEWVNNGDNYNIRN